MNLKTMKTNFHFPLIAFFSLAFLHGCQNTGRVPLNLNSCTTTHCLETFQSDIIPQDDFWRFDSLAVLPPSIALDERDLNGEVNQELYINDEGQTALIEQLDSFSNSYQVTNIPAQTDEIDPQLVLQFEQTIWADSPTIESILSSKDRYGKPRLSNPTLDGPVEIPAEISKAAPNNTCCLLVTRLSGWQHTNSAVGTKIAVNSFFAALTGGVGASITLGQAISDMAVIRIDDGAILWSGRMLSTGHISQLRTTARDYYLQVYESKIANQM
ncbi:hypothetical protein [Alcanivorax sp. S6407]|uniref:hypothetical protein n=1 Tax=Alcanivorax sp. S6407 TaxID=2926424 RepID=UPI001FF50B62|nr:hypothetical protein [Alcanivorax sp. S6407]